MARDVACTYHPDGRHLWSSSGKCLCGLDANVLAEALQSIAATSITSVGTPHEFPRPAGFVEFAKKALTVADAQAADDKEGKV